MAFRPYWPPQDDPMTVSFDVANRLKDSGYPQDLCRLGWGKKQDDDFFKLYPLADSVVAAPSFSELSAYYLENGTLSSVTLFCRRCYFLALDDSVDRRAGTPDDALGELVLAKLGDNRHTRL